jgi:hypothetical protein
MASPASDSFPDPPDRADREGEAPETAGRPDGTPTAEDRMPEAQTGARPFLTATWRSLAIITYAVPPERVAPHLPPGVEPDTRGGEAFASLVGFDFLDTRVLGVPWPGYRRFPEFNLRFYAQHDGRRGVAFYRELVPKRLVAWIARTLYGEPYRAVPMQNTPRITADTLTMTYRFDWKGREQRVRVRGQRPARFPETEDSTADFFKEHRWGFGTTRGGRPVRYEVLHPRWKIYPVNECHVQLDWGSVYGPEWQFLADADPVSVVLAKGSPVEVYWRTALQA